MPAIKYSGVKIFVGSSERVVPALSVLQVRAHRAILVRFKTFAQEEPTDAELDALVACIGDALRRNYPDLSDKDLEPELDMRSIAECISAIVSQTQLEVVRPGEAVAGS